MSQDSHRSKLRRRVLGRQLAEMHAGTELQARRVLEGIGHDFRGNTYDFYIHL
jgi:hypothetical protein